MPLIDNRNKKLSSRVNVSDLLFNNFYFELVSCKEVIAQYERPNRFYHNMDHIKEMIKYIYNVHVLNKCFSADEYNAMLAAIIFHDVVYDTKSKTNEEDSVEYFKSMVDFIRKANKYDDGAVEIADYWQELTPLVERLIMATKKHDYENADELERWIIKADLDRFNEPDFPKFWQNTVNLFKEYCHVEADEFINGRIAFLDEYANRISKFMKPVAVENILKLKPALQCWKPSIAVYPGSFNPFHEGHRNILQKAEKIFDKVIIAKGVNSEKQNQDQFPIPLEISQTHQVDHYEGMLTDYIATKNYPVTVIRGLRNSTDLQFELNQYRHLQDLMPEIQVISIFCDSQFEHVSSSAVRTFHKYGKSNRWEI